MTPMPLLFDISDDDNFELPDLKPVVTKQSTLFNNSQPVSWYNTSNVDDIDKFPNSLFSRSAVNMDVDSMNDSEQKFQLFVSLDGSVAYLGGIRCQYINLDAQTNCR